MGETILESGKIPVRSLASYTAATDPMVGHAWLSEVVFATLFRIGGLALIAIVTSVIVGLTHALIARFLRSRGADARLSLIGAVLSFAVASIHWLARPHLFSIFGAALTLFLLESKRKRYWIVGPLFVLWTNLHGASVYGIMMICIYVLGDLVELAMKHGARDETLSRIRRNGLYAAIALISTLVNPFGLSLHREVLFAATSSSLAKNIGEYLPPDFQDASQVPFLISIAATLVALGWSKRRVPARQLLLIIISLLLALRSFRNIALFAVAGLPLVALHMVYSWPRAATPGGLFKHFARIDFDTRPGLYALPVGVLILAIGLNSGSVGGVKLISDKFSPKAFPVEAVKRLSSAQINGRVFDYWKWGGYIMYAWPGASLHVDPLKFNDTTMKTYSVIDELAPGWQEELQRWRVGIVIVETRSRLAKGLKRERGWRVWYQDSLATVFRPVSSPSP
jgi:hypothetical protein